MSQASSQLARIGWSSHSVSIVFHTLEKVRAAITILARLCFPSACSCGRSAHPGQLFLRELLLGGIVLQNRGKYEIERKREKRENERNRGSMGSTHCVLLCSLFPHVKYC